MRRGLLWLTLALVALLPAIAAAQIDVNRDPAALRPATQGVRPTPSSLGPDGPWGSNRGGKFIAASQFTVPLSASAPTLTYDGFHFYNSPGSTNATAYFAQLDLEPGVLVDLVTCIYRDSSTTNDVYFGLQLYTTDVSAQTSSGTTLASCSSSGTPGMAGCFVDPATPFTFSTFDGSWTLYDYYIRADVANDTAIAGCWVWYKRQVAPGPATATFGDVPTTSTFFKYVEALYSSGVIAGCGGGNYCPNNPVTRGQMAVYLALSLGMGYLY